MQRENPHLTFELFIATDGTDFSGARNGSYEQPKLIEVCERFVSLKNVTLTIAGIIPQKQDYTKITEDKPIPGLTLANLLFKYATKCLLCSGNETSLTSIFQKQEKFQIGDITFCNEFKLPIGTNIIAFLTELMLHHVEIAECLSSEQYDILLDNVVTLCVLQLKNVVNPLNKTVPWFNRVKDAMIAIGTHIYAKMIQLLSKLSKMQLLTSLPNISSKFLKEMLVCAVDHLWRENKLCLRRLTPS